MSNENELKQVLNVRISAELQERLNRMIELTGLSRTEVVERVLSFGLADEERTMRWLVNPWTGALFRFATHPRVLKAIGMVSDEVVDERLQKAKASVVKKARKSAGGRRVRAGG